MKATISMLESQDRQWQQGIDRDEIEDPMLLADADSFFCDINGVRIHHKIYEPDEFDPDSSLHERTKRTKHPMILLHGFGASLFSWSRASKDLANASGSKVLAFDRPAFGLTSRVVRVEDSITLNPYSRMFSVLATLHFVDALADNKAILVGHSAGALVAVDTYFEAPENVAALILVAPAILAPSVMQIKVKEKRKESNSNTRWNTFTQLWSVLSILAVFIADTIVSLYRRALPVILRSTIGLIMIRTMIEKFGIPFIRFSWYDSSKVSDLVLEGYTKPMKLKDWDKALAEYALAMLTDFATKAKRPLAERLSKITCPVLIIAGDTDRVVPFWNTARLSRAIPGSYLEVIKNCGHLPQEEQPEEFVCIVDRLLKNVS